MTHVCKAMGIIIRISKRKLLVYLCSAAQFPPWHCKGLLFQPIDAVKCLGPYDSVLQQAYKLPFILKAENTCGLRLFSSAFMVVQLAVQALHSVFHSIATRYTLTRSVSQCCICEAYLHQFTADKSGGCGRPGHLSLPLSQET